jgi:hypothetical protein
VEEADLRIREEGRSAEELLKAERSIGWRSGGFVGSERRC